MKVEISEHGYLVVKAETGTEAFALQRWWGDFSGLLQHHIRDGRQYAEHAAGSTPVGITIDTTLPAP